jgi:hypothetical protein
MEGMHRALEAQCFGPSKKSTLFPSSCWAFLSVHVRYFLTGYTSEGYGRHPRIRAYHFVYTVPFLQSSNLQRTKVYASFSSLNNEG